MSAPPLPEALQAVADEVRGFLPADEADALRAAAAAHLRAGGVAVEIGSYCGKSAVHLGHVARERGARLVTIDHHRGSEEQQVGWEYHDETLVGTDGRMDTLPFLRETLARAGLEDVVDVVVARSPDVASWWGRELDLVFVDGGHTDEHAQGDYEGWAGWVRPGGVLVIHDVFPDPADGGQAPYRIYLRALDDGFTEVGHTGSLRVLRR
ncbi:MULTISPECIES: class I SAM-dependent methyltransferase [unclassified Aeromicrobium]|uniref:class I SAM-dependent methyltransferase n=1 Tax=unclassified Aeromicrobium TaxID=2633570 RepID=UPI00288AA40A|nr:MULTISPECIES: class I SAM-dependent methyltransferase [unclassified Aeromicrobium]